jgi:hypothetical protein
MKLTIPGKDLIRIDEDSIDNYKKDVKNGKKFHIIKFDFKDPTSDKIDDVIKSFNNTNRFIIYNNIRLYNGHLKNVGKKYYIQNTSGDNFVSFVRKNNKILVDFTRMTQSTKTFLMENYFEDILYNTEIIVIDENDLENDEYSSLLKNWQGNVVIKDATYII